MNKWEYSSKDDDWYLEGEKVYAFLYQKGINWCWFIEHYDYYKGTNVMTKGDNCSTFAIAKKTASKALKRIDEMLMKGVDK